jgi:hypothetical protein
MQIYSCTEHASLVFRKNGLRQTGFVLTYGLLTEHESYIQNVLKKNNADSSFLWTGNSSPTLTFENKGLRSRHVLCPKTQKVGGWRKLHDAELHSFSLYIIR